MEKEHEDRMKSLFNVYGNDIKIVRSGTSIYTCKALCSDFTISIIDNRNFKADVGDMIVKCKKSKTEIEREILTITKNDGIVTFKI